MTVSSLTSKIQYSGDGVSVAFAFPFPYFAASDLAVYVENINTGAVNGGNLNGAGPDDFAVAGLNFQAGTGAYSGGTITINAPLPAGSVLTIARSVVDTQQNSYNDNALLPAKSIEGGLDRLTMKTQELSDAASRAISAPVYDQAPSMLLPPAASRASQIVGFDAAGNLMTYLLTALGGPVPNNPPVVQADSVAAITNINGLTLGAKAIILSGYRLPNDGGGGVLVYDPNDVTSPTDYGHIFVTPDGRRFKRFQTNPNQFNPCDFGAYNDDVSDNNASLQLMANACVKQSQGATVFLPGGGGFYSSSPTTFTYPAGEFGLVFADTGNAASVLIYGPAADGLIINMSDALHSVNIRDFAIVTEGTFNRKAIALTNTAPNALAIPHRNHIERVTFDAETLGNGWGKCLYVRGVSFGVVRDCFVRTANITDAQAAGGLTADGIDIAGINGNAVLEWKISGTGFFGGYWSIVLGTMVSDITLHDNTFFNNKNCLVVTAGAVNVNGVIVTSNKLRGYGDAITVVPPCSEIKVIGNEFIGQANVNGIVLLADGPTNWGNLQIIGNNMYNYSGTGSAVLAIAQVAGYQIVGGIVSGNILLGNGTALNLANASGWHVGSDNIYGSNTVDVSNPNGTANYIGPQQP